MKNTTLSLSALALLAVGCATGPKFAETEGRIWFHRPSKVIGSAVQPHVWVNGVAVGKAQPGCFFFVDRAPGTYEVKCATEWTDKFQLTLQARDEKYVRLTMAPGVFVGHVIPSEVDKAKAEKELAGCKLITADGANANLKQK